MDAAEKAWANVAARSIAATLETAGALLLLWGLLYAMTKNDATAGYEGVERAVVALGHELVFGFVLLDVAGGFLLLGVARIIRLLARIAEK
jgi:hypothetical protein